MTSRQRSANCKIIAVVIVNSYELPNSADHQLRNIAGVKYLKADHSKDQFQEDANLRAVRFRRLQYAWGFSQQHPQLVFQDVCRAFSYPQLSVSAF
jgi:hypothetical protein